MWREGHAASTVKEIAEIAPLSSAGRPRADIEKLWNPPFMFIRRREPAQTQLGIHLRCDASVSLARRSC
jgi:hypothetical protein